MSDDSLLGQLAEEFTRSMRAGKLPDIEEYAGCYPELAGALPHWLKLEPIHACGIGPLGGRVFVRADSPEASVN